MSLSTRCFWIVHNHAEAQNLGIASSAHVLKFASDRELRTFYHFCLRFKSKRLPLKGAN